MSRIIVGIPKREMGIQIRNLLVRNGFDVTGVCISGTQILNYADLLGEGIVICSCQLTDMMCGELRADLPHTFQMLVLTTGRYPVEEDESVKTLALPLKVQDLLEQVRQMEEIAARKRRQMRQGKSRRNEWQNQIVSRAKERLMDKKGMSEEEAHRYLQKCSMESGNSMTETAQMLLKMLEGTIIDKEDK